ncbi:hypothetical protein [Billgrantia antri]|uniref:hypothetical protein n=1 Tax=Billgrantia antri TaxID=2846777 RepID=UPI003B222DB4
MVTVALARLHRNAGGKVRVFKHGPDYLDPMVQEVASGQPVYQLHSWMPSEAECRWRLAGSPAEPVYVEGKLVASYLHGYFPSAPALTAAIFRGEPLRFTRTTTRRQPCV